MKFLRRSLVGLFLVSITLALLVWAGQIVSTAVETRMADEPGARPAAERVFAVNVVDVAPGTITPRLTAFGEVRSRRTLDIRAPQAGTIVALSEDFQEGGQVRAGELLVRIDQADAMTAVDTAATDVAEAEAELRDATRTLELAREDLAAAEQQLALREQALARQEDLATRGVNTRGALEDAEIAASSARQSLVGKRQAIAQAEGRVDLARARLERTRISQAEAERRLAETEIMAEFSGTLGAVTVVEGGLVTANEKLAELTDPEALEVSFRVSTAQYARLLEEGRLTSAPVTVSIDVGGIELSTTGRISRESAGVGEGQTGRLLFAQIDSATGLRPGDFVTVTVEEPPLDFAALLPATAVDSAGTVLLIGAEDRLEAIEVDLLRRQGDDVIVRARGIAGRAVVAERAPVLGAGIKVRALRPETGGVPEEPEVVELDPERRARLVAFVEANERMPKDVKERILAQLAQPAVPAQMIERIESRMGG